jgi:hypothetical protein
MTSKRPRRVRHPWVAVCSHTVGQCLHFWHPAANDSPLSKTGILMRLLLALLLLVSHDASTQPVRQLHASATPPSIVEIPLRISLDRLFEVAEQEMPREAGNWRTWRETHGVNTKYHAWRGPLYLAMHGQVLTVQAQVAYWIRAHKQVLGVLDLESSCGVEEPLRRAIIGVQIRLDWSPDWTLRPLFRVMTTRFLDRCEMTLAEIDVTPLIAREFQKQLQERMRAALRTLAPRLAGIRQQVERNWLLLQQPVQLQADEWLSLNPAGVALSPLAGQGNTLDARLAVLMKPQVLTDPEPVSHPRPLPPLQRYYPRSAGLNLKLFVDVDYDGLNGVLSRELSGEPLDIKGRRLTIESLKMGGQGQEIHVDARLGGDFAGDVRLRAEMRFAPETQQLLVQNLSYEYEPDDPWLQAEAELLYGYIRKLLEAAANRHLKQYMEQGRQRLYALFEKIAPEGVKVDMTTLKLHQVQLDLAEEAIRLHGLASGQIELVFR